MSYKDCKYYIDSEKQGHCPFDICCDKDCYFVYKQNAKDVEELLERIDELELQLENSDNYEQEVEELTDEINVLEEQIEELKDKIEQLEQIIEELWL